MTISRSALLRDLVLALLAIAAGMAVLPGIIFLVGGKLFSAYQGGLGQFYVNLFNDLLTLGRPAWALTLLPAMCVLLLRWIWRTPQHVELPAEPASRREPTL